MDEVILRHLCGEATDVDRGRLDEWRTASPENEIRFRQLQVLWGGLERVRSRRPATRPDIDAMLQEAERRRSASRTITFRKPPFRTLWAG
jgi:ferric-dicitrate binding protein FerR (iron transport regulator)